jgi:hypothetical protein
MSHPILPSQQDPATLSAIHQHIPSFLKVSTPVDGTGDPSFRSGGMFGMLDYRASKLYRLLAFPLKLTSFLIEHVIVIISVVLTGYYTSAFINYLANLASSQKNAGVANFLNNYEVLLFSHFAVGIVFYLIFSLIFGAIWLVAVARLFDKLFFYIIDVVLAEGRSYEQSMGVVKGGDIVRLLLKLQVPETWTDSDTNEFIRRHPIIVRILYGEDIRSRYDRLIPILKKAKQDGLDLSTENYALRQRIQPIDAESSWQEKLISMGWVRLNVWLLAFFILCFYLYHK